MMQQSSQHFTDQLELLNTQLSRLGGLVEEAVARGVRALVDRDTEAAGEVIEGDAAIDALELAIDGQCMELLARNQPLAGDLRFITAVMRITPELERIADHAVNISECAVELNEEPPLKTLADIPQMARRAQEMVRSALDAFSNRDADAARAVIKMDRELNRWMEHGFRILLSHMLEDPRTITRSLRLSFAAKHFERIGDQVKNICEQVVYMSEGRVIKHRDVPRPTGEV